MNRWQAISIALTMACCVWLAAQSRPYTQKQFVSFEGAPVAAAAPGGSGHTELHFRVSKGDHINSNQPGSELLIPTKLSLSSPSDLVVGNVTYPKGQALTLAVAPDEKLSVYSGDFSIGAAVTPTAKAAPGTYRVHGELQYQACSDRACYPPEKLPVAFDVKVLKAGNTATHRNPPQTPHAR